MRKRELKNMEWGLVIVAVILTIIGLVALFSATQETEYDEFKKQIIWFVVSIVAMILTMLINYETLVKISPVLYVIFLILLVAVMFTTPVNGQLNEPLYLRTLEVRTAVPVVDELRDLRVHGFGHGCRIFMENKALIFNAQAVVLVVLDGEADVEGDHIFLHCSSTSA